MSINNLEKFRQFLWFLEAERKKTRKSGGKWQITAVQTGKFQNIPLQRERYDLVIKTENLENPIYKEILNIINSDEFKDELVGLGGYDLKDTGRIIAET